MNSSRSKDRTSDTVRKSETNFECDNEWMWSGCERVSLKHPIKSLFSKRPALEGCRQGHHLIPKMERGDELKWGIPFEHVSF